MQHCICDNSWRKSAMVTWVSQSQTTYTSILKALSTIYRLAKKFIWVFPLHLTGLMLKLQYFGHLVWRADSLEKILMLGKIKGRRRRGWQRDKMVGWHHWLGHEFEQTPGDSEGQGSLACCSPWGRKKSDTTYPLNNNRVYIYSESSQLFGAVPQSYLRGCLSGYSPQWGLNPIKPNTALMLRIFISVNKL